MPAAITEFVDVNVTLTGAAADKRGFGSVLGIFDHAVTANRQDGPYTSVQEAVDAGFTAAAEPEVNAFVSAVFSQDDGVDSVLIGREDVGDADWMATMTAVEAADPSSWYITCVETRAEADLLLVAAYIEATASSSFPKIYIAQSSDAVLLAGTVGNVGEDLQTAGYHRTGLIYHAFDDAAAGNAPADGYLDGGWASSGGGLDLDAPQGVGTWAYRQLDGIAFDSVTAAEAATLYGYDANLFGRNKGLNFTSKGTASSGRYLDVTSSLDWLTARLEEEILSAFVGAGTKIPYTNAGINIIRAAVQAVYDRGISFGHISDDAANAPTLTAPDISEVSATDKANRELTLTGNVVLSGAIHKTTLNINVQQ
jgi:hypothetical protein